MAAKGQRIDKRTGKLGPSPLQERVAQIMHKDPTISAGKAMILAGYSKNSALNPTANVIGSKGFSNLQDVYLYELARKGVNPKLLAQVTKKGLKDQDKKTVLAYAIEAKKDLELSKDTADTAIQINLSSEINELAE